MNERERRPRRPGRIRAQGLAFKAFVPDTEPRAHNAETFLMVWDVIAAIRELTSRPGGDEDPPTE